MKALLYSTVLLWLTACSTGDQDQDFTREYLDALERHAGTDTDMGAGVRRFMAVFENLHDDRLEDRVRSAYAPRLHFNDTLHSFHDREALHEYLKQTAERIESMDTALLGWSQDGRDIYVRWTMETRFRILGRQSSPRTQGMTHLRFDHHGRIILQQDFWDSSRGFLEHIPIFGGSIRWLRARL